MTQTKTLFAISALTVMISLVGASQQVDAAAYMKLGDIKGESTAKGHEGWIVLDSMQFGIDNTQKKFPKGEKGGTEDINIGIGELQECTISKSMDAASAHLAQFAINGNSPGLAEIEFTTIDPRTGEEVTYLKYKLDRVFVKSWSVSGDADDRPTEEVAFYYNKIAFAYQEQGEEGPKETHVMSWDNVRNTPWDGAFPGSIERVVEDLGKSKNK